MDNLKTMLVAFLEKHTGKDRYSYPFVLSCCFLLLVFSNQNSQNLLSIEMFVVTVLVHSITGNTYFIH